tara:strand:- start:398 stop:760 length:363 start_codon:yes stop_codon:yes gene_type:complete
VGFPTPNRAIGGLDIMRTKSGTKENIAPRIVCTAPWRLTKVKPLPNYEIEVEFNDGTHGFIEMTALIMSERAGVFSILKDKAIFDQAHLEYGVLTWPGEIDLAPDAMHDAIKQKGRWILQ